MAVILLLSIAVAREAFILFPVAQPSFADPLVPDNPALAKVVHDYKFDLVCASGLALGPIAQSDQAGNTMTILGTYADRYLTVLLIRVHGPAVTGWDTALSFEMAGRWNWRADMRSWLTEFDQETNELYVALYSTPGVPWWAGRKLAFIAEANQASFSFALPVRPISSAQQTEFIIAEPLYGGQTDAKVVLTPAVTALEMNAENGVWPLLQLIDEDGRMLEHRYGNLHVYPPLGVGKTSHIGDGREPTASRVITVNVTGYLMLEEVNLALRTGAAYTSDRVTAKITEIQTSQSGSRIEVEWQDLIGKFARMDVHFQLGDSYVSPLPDVDDTEPGKLIITYPYDCSRYSLRLFLRGQDAGEGTYVFTR